MIILILFTFHHKWVFYLGILDLGYYLFSSCDWIALQFDAMRAFSLIGMLSLLDLPLQLAISLKKEDNDPEKNQYDEHFYAGGLIEYVNWLNTDKVLLYFFEQLSWLLFYCLQPLFCYIISFSKLANS